MSHPEQHMDSPYWADMHIELARLRAEAAALRRALQEARADVEQLSRANLNDDNCASWEVANRRIRNVACRALAAIDAALPKAP